MSTVSLAALIEALDRPCRDALEQAAVNCAGRGGYEIAIDDYMECLLPLDGMRDILVQFECNPDALRELVGKRPAGGRHTGRPAFSPLLYQLLQEAYLLTTLDLGRESITVGALVLALLRNPVRYGLLPFYKELKGISADELLRLLQGLEEANRPSPAAPAGAPADALAQYAVDFTEDARNGKTDPVFARGPEIRMVVDILARRRKNNPILVGDPGVGKTAVVEGLALKVVRGEVPDALKGVRIVGLDMGRLQAGASVKGEFERRLKAVIDEVKAAPVPTILFIDEAHTLVGSGGPAGGGDGANLLKPALARGEMRTIAATTWSEYKKYFEKDAALARRFQPVRLDEPSLEDTVTILRGIVPHYEQAHRVYVRDDAVIRTAELAGRYITGRRLPDKAIDVLDTACAKVKVSLGARPAVLEALEEELAAARRELDALERDRRTGIPADDMQESETRHAALRGRCEELAARAADTETQWRRERDLVEAILERRAAEHAGDAPTDGEPAASPAEKNGEAEETAAAEAGVSSEILAEQLRHIQGNAPLVFHEVSPELVTSIVSEWTGIPAGKLDGGGGAALSRLGQNLRARIKGQDHALEAIEKAVLSAHAGLDSPTRPTGIFLLVGPSGVGKTETALAVADALFGGERLLISINMSEFQEKHTISRLIGSPPGYVGYGEGGRLTEAVRRQPYSVVLFDEVEKAHPDILHLFYQMFDKGTLADGEGREVDFRNTVIFLTSNLGSDIVTALCEENETPDPKLLGEALQPLLSQTFRPALLGRMTVVPYLAIRREILRELTDMKLAQVADRLQRRHHIPLIWDEDVADSITASCSAVDTGARNIDHIINGHLLPRLATALLAPPPDGDGGPRSLRVRLNAADGAFSCVPEPRS